MPKNQTPAERTLQARAASHRSWALTADRSARTAPARERFLSRFEREVDPERRLSLADRRRRAENARTAYFTSLALKSAKARRRRSR